MKIKLFRLLIIVCLCIVVSNFNGLAQIPKQPITVQSPNAASLGLYKVQSWNDLESLLQNSKTLVSSILENIRSVSRNPTVSQRPDGLLKVRKDSRKEAVTQGK